MRRMSALTLLLFIGPAFGQSLTPFERGTQSFRAVLNRCGLKPVESITDALIDPSHTLIVMFGDLNVHDNEFANGGMRKFIRRGGAMFMASDRNSFGEMWVQLEIAVNGIKITGPDDDPDVIYRGELRDCPMLQHPVRENVRSSLDLLGSMRVATNRPSFFNRVPDPGEDIPGLPPILFQPQNPEMPRLNSRRIIAELPSGCVAVDGPKPLVPHDRFLLALADTIGKGRYVVVADHTMFLNIMMLQQDNDNVAFAMKLTRWLTEDGQRKQVYFMDDGRVRTDFSLNIDYVDPPLPHPDVLGPMVDQLVGSLEQDDFFNQGIRRLIQPRKILRGVLLTATILAAGYLLVRMISGRFRPDRAVARLPERLGDLPVGAPPAATPTAATIALSAQELALGSLERLIDHPLDVIHPPITAGSSAWVARVQSLWETAQGKSRHAFKPAELERLARDLTDLERAVERGDVRLTTGVTS